ncbi:hypothetical protein Dsin_021978 [Dipteronia sinensis]|uniref:RNase H type-1 domain-containing protein n=1 Tax=Dipteronia sinensis TaxID=43782 RepID=A0AAE0DZB4_9ROSI|nr:hypothetical protein Dsin_021978 [Dipteronia sinensis]
MLWILEKATKLAKNEDPNKMDKVETWIDAHKHKDGTSGSQKALNPQGTSHLSVPGRDWIDPPPDQLKINSAAVVRGGFCLMGVGVAIRNDRGKVIAALSKPIHGHFCPVIGAFLALREGLLLAKLHKFQIHIAEVGPSIVVSSLNSSEGVPGDASFIANDIRTLFIEVGICKCQATPKSGNALAHKLVALASSSAKESLWLDPSPSQ